MSRMSAALSCSRLPRRDSRETQRSSLTTCDTAASAERSAARNFMFDPADEFRIAQEARVRLENGDVAVEAHGKLALQAIELDAGPADCRVQPFDFPLLRPPPARPTGPLRACLCGATDHACYPARQPRTDRLACQNHGVMSTVRAYGRRYRKSPTQNFPLLRSLIVLTYCAKKLKTMKMISPATTSHTSQSAATAMPRRLRRACSSNCGLNLCKVSGTVPDVSATSTRL